MMQKRMNMFLEREGEREGGREREREKERVRERDEASTC